MQLHRFFPPRAAITFAPATPLANKSNHVSTPRFSHLHRDVCQIRALQPKPRVGDELAQLHEYLQQGEGEFAEADSAIRLNPALLETRDKEGLTPVLWAASQDNDQALEFLLQQRPGLLHQTDTYGQTIMHLAAISGSNSDGKALCYLLKNPLSKPLINAKDWDGDTPVDAVQDLCNAKGLDEEEIEEINEVLELLRKHGGRPSAELAQNHGAQPEFGMRPPPVPE